MSGVCQTKEICYVLSFGFPSKKYSRKFEFSSSDWNKEISITADVNEGVKVTVKEFSDSDTKAVNILSDKNWRPTSGDLPLLITPTGLDATRQWYLYNEIREYCSEETQDRVCPLPRVSPSSNTEETED